MPIDSGIPHSVKTSYGERQHFGSRGRFTESTEHFCEDEKTKLKKYCKVCPKEILKACRKSSWGFNVIKYGR